MKAQLTKELKERFFALYSGQRVLDATMYGSGMICPCIYILDVLPMSKLSLRKDSQLSNGEMLRIAVDMGLSIQNKPAEYVRNMVLMTSMWSNTSVTPKQLFHLRDLLISRGVAVEFMGHSVREMVEAGWIHLMEESQTQE